MGYLSKGVTNSDSCFGKLMLNRGGWAKSGEMTQGSRAMVRAGRARGEHRGAQSMGIQTGLARPEALDGCGREGGGECSANGVDGEGRRHVYFLEFQYY